jgi:CheY-like chemotaxis protein
MSQPANILIVDDSGTNLFLLQGLLEDEGYSVIITEDPREGLRFLDHYKNIDLILLDIMMPRIDGFEFMKKLSEKDLSDIPVVVVTAKDDRNTQEKANNMGAVGYLTKPLNIRQVLETIREHVD